MLNIEIIVTSCRVGCSLDSKNEFLDRCFKHFDSKSHRFCDCNYCNYFQMGNIAKREQSPISLEEISISLLECYLKQLPINKM